MEGGTSQPQDALTLTIQLDEIGRKLVAWSLLHRLAGGFAPLSGVEGGQHHVPCRGGVHQGQIYPLCEREKGAEHLGPADDGDLAGTPCSGQRAGEIESGGGGCHDMDAGRGEIALSGS